jgi:hypothetical protein
LYTDTGDGDGQITNEGLQRIKWMISLLEPNQKLADTEWSPRLPGLAVAAAAPAGLFGMASRAEVAEVYERFMGQQEATFDRHLWELEAHSLENGLEGWSTIEKLQYLPITILLPTLSAARYSVETSRGMRDGVLAGIALELYRREHGDWPKSLDQLAPRWLPSVPIDRMTGGPLGYKIIDDRPVVYSVGVDRDDDGGRAPVDADGNSDSVLASPNHFELQPVADESHNGDWLIWSPPAAADKQGT